MEVCTIESSFSSDFRWSDLYHSLTFDLMVAFSMIYFPNDSRRCLLLAQARPIVFYWFYKVFLSTVFSLVVVPSQKGHARCTQGGKLVFHWFYNGCLAELSVPEGGRQRWDSSIECRAMWEMLDFLRFYKVSGPTVLARFFGQAIWAGTLCFTNVLWPFFGHFNCTNPHNRKLFSCYMRNILSVQTEK